MIERTGPYDKPPRQPKDFAQKHPVRNALGNLAAILFGIIIFLGVLAFLALMIGGTFGR